MLTFIAKAHWLDMESDAIKMTKLIPTTYDIGLLEKYHDAISSSEYIKYAVRVLEGWQDPINRVYNSSQDKFRLECRSLVRKWMFDDPRIVDGTILIDKTIL